ncbi:DUF6867 family protein [Methylocapsa acidiphila]|uniref:DUF6867 family protein n=1 Tax=Methylocapsa acidiphila TaxID=133552 RepID=UPI0003FAFE83|nr:hypothetical protein [Methylocapsa acidiphila]
MTPGFGALFDVEAPLAFLGLSVILGGAAAASIGRALASTWRPLWVAPASCLGVAAAVRFLHFALIGAPLLSWPAYTLDFMVSAGVACIAFKRTRARQMKQIYGWIDAAPKTGRQVRGS